MSVRGRLAEETVDRATARPLARLRTNVAAKQRVGQEDWRMEIGEVCGQLLFDDPAVVDCVSLPLPFMSSV